MFDNFVVQFQNKLPTIIFAVIFFIVGIIISKLCIKLMSRGLSKSKLDPTYHSFLKSLVKVVLYTIIIVIVLSKLDVPTSSIVAVIGAAGLAVGLSLQNSLSNLAGGFIILFSKPFKVGDYIEAENISGTVHAISILYTRLITIDNKVIYIPNGKISSAVLTNYNGEKIRRLDLIFSISYNNDFRQAKNIILDVINKNPLSILEPAPIARVTEHGANSLKIDAKVWVLADDYWSLRYDILEDIKLRFDEEGIQIPFSQLDVNLKKD